MKQMLIVIKETYFTSSEIMELFLMVLLPFSSLD